MGKKNKKSTEHQQKQPQQKQPQQKQSQHKQPQQQKEVNKRDTRFLAFDLYDYFVLGLTVYHVLINPYTKVEETFITNNMYDHLVYKDNIRGIWNGSDWDRIMEYDFIEFPGVVERSFIPSLIISFLSYPVHHLLVELNQYSVITSLYLTRIVLGLLGFLSLRYVKVTIERVLRSKTISECFSILFIIQFHPLFYISRPLPNTFAWALTNLAYAFWMQRRWEWTISLLAVASIIFRCDIVVFAFALIAVDLVRLKLPFFKWLIYGGLTSVVCITLTVIVDSHFWGWWLWPEFNVFKFNTVMNKSSEWGVSPWYWYFAMAIPKSVTIAFPLALFAVVYKPKTSYIDWGIVELLSPALIFVGLYSFLPHKELRFIFPALTVINLAGAMGMTKIFKKLSKSEILNFLLFLGLVIGILLSLFSTTLLTYISYYNYPGGMAMREFNRDYLSFMDQSNSPKIAEGPNIHIDVYPAMTGITRFLYEKHDKGWRYNRTEYLTDEEKKAFTHLFTDRPKIEGFRLYKPIESFSRVDLRNREIVFKKSMYIHEREDIYQERISRRTPSGTKCSDKT